MTDEGATAEGMVLGKISAGLLGIALGAFVIVLLTGGG
jgi:hypothetical protein